MQKVVTAGRYTIQLFASEPIGSCQTIVYLNGGHEQAEQIWDKLCDLKMYRKPVVQADSSNVKEANRDDVHEGGIDFILAVITGFDWNADLSPWEAKKVFRQGEDFKGHAAAYLKDMQELIIPEVERNLQITSRGIAGYSLAGLFAVWALYQTDLFDRAASVSGSLWFDGFGAYMEQEHLLRIPEKVYFSVGAKEKRTNNERMAKVELVTEKAEQIMSAQGVETAYEINEGGHFTDVELRIAKGIEFIV